MLRRLRRLTPAFALGTLLLAVWPGAAVAPAVSGWPPDAALIVYPERPLVPQDPRAQLALIAGHAGVREFVGRHPGWRATVDPLTGSVDRAFGDGLELEDPTGRLFLARYRALMAPGSESNGQTLVANETASAPLAGGAARALTFDLVKDGLPVIGAGLSLGVRDDKVVLITTSALGPVAVSSRPAIDGAEALAMASHYAGAAEGTLLRQREPSLAIYPRARNEAGAPALRHHLIWRLQVKPPEAPFWEVYNAWVDAHDGSVLAFFPEALSLGACAADPNQARGTVVGGVRPNRADDPEVKVHFPFARVSVKGALVTSDLNGHYPFAGGPVSASLSGDIFRIHCDNCTQPAQPFAGADASGTVDFGTGGGSSGPPVFGNNLSTPADRAAYYHLHQARLLLSKWDSAPFDEIEAFVNIPQTCNAFSMSYLVGFFVAGGNCRNTGEIRDVMQHELGHNWDRFDGNDITDGGLSEWKGDLIALAIGGDACMAESFRISTGFPSPGCSGVRDIDEKTANRGTISVASNPCLGEPHCVGEIPGQASWHLLNNFRTGVDYATGLPLAAGNPALSVEEARWILERLLIGGGPPMQVVNPASAGISIYDAAMLMDDDDANLANGTPHAAYINPAFAHHGLAETPQVGDAAACAPLSDPIVTATLERDPATGLPEVILDWAGAGGGAIYDVYRNTRAGDAFLPLARGLAAGSFADAGVQVGATYRYFVAQVRRTGCAGVSPGGNIVSVTVAPTELRVAGAAFSEAPSGADGDGLIEPGERILVEAALGEIGNAAGATGVTATVTSASGASPIVAGGPVSYGSVPAGGSTAAPAAFELFIGPSEPCGGTVHLTLSASGNEGCWLDGIDVPIDATGGCAATAAAFVEVVPGSLHVVTSTGDGDLIPDNCEATRAAYQIRNAGALASGPVVTSVRSTLGGVTIAPASSCAGASLGGGATADCEFGFSLGGGTPAGIPFTLSATSASNPAPSTIQAALGAETDPPVFSTQSFGFEGSLEGWTAREFALSAARASSGLQSAHAGSTTTPNICGKLTSPAFLLNPAGSSTLSMRMYADIEPFTDQFYDRANVHLVDIDTGVHTVLAPSSGPAYNAFGNAQGGLCHNSGQTAWAGFLGGFNLVTFDLSAWAGRRVQIEVNYGTDELDDREGIYVDDVTVTNAAGAALPADLQPDACVVSEVSAVSAPAPFDVSPMPGNLLRFRWEDLGPGVVYNLYAGAIGAYYSHGAGPVACMASGASCDGAVCTLDQGMAALPGGSLYFLVTATEFGLEGTSGFDSAGSERDPAQNTCAP